MKMIGELAECSVWTKSMRKVYGTIWKLPTFIYITQLDVFILF